MVEWYGIVVSRWGSFVLLVGSIQEARNKELFFGYIHLSYSLLLVVFLLWNRIRFIHTAAILSLLIESSRDQIARHVLVPALSKHTSARDCKRLLRVPTRPPSEKGLKGLLIQDLFPETLESPEKKKKLN